jgi:hypothetical protein
MSQDTTENEAAKKAPLSSEAPPVKKHGFFTKSAVITWAIVLALVAVIGAVAATTMKGTKSTGTFSTSANSIGS